MMRKFSFLVKLSLKLCLMNVKLEIDFLSDAVSLQISDVQSTPI